MSARAKSSASVRSSAARVAGSSRRRSWRRTRSRPGGWSMWVASSTAPARFTSMRTASVRPGKYVGSAGIKTRSPGPVLSPPLRLVHEDGALLVIDKPAGLLTIATERDRERTAYRLVWAYLAAQRPPRRPFVVHRLDRETSGLIVVAKSVAAKRALQ